MADDKNVGRGAARESTISELSRKKQKLEEEKRKSLAREQVIFILIALLSISPIVAAFIVKDSDLSMKLFMIGGAALVLFYPAYLIIRAIVGAALKSK